LDNDDESRKPQVFDPFYQFREQLFEQTAPSLSRAQFAQKLLNYLEREPDAPKLSDEMIDEIFRRACELSQLTAIQAQCLQHKVEKDLERCTELLIKIRKSLKKLASASARGARTARLPMEKGCLKALISSTDELLDRQRSAALLFKNELSSEPLREFTWDVDLYLKRECKFKPADRNLVIPSALKAIGKFPDTPEDLTERTGMQRTRASRWIKKTRLNDPEFQ